MAPSEFSDASKDCTAPGPGGRPRAEIDLGLVERSAHIGCTNDEIVALLGIARSTFVGAVSTGKWREG